MMYDSMAMVLTYFQHASYLWYEQVNMICLRQKSKTYVY